MTTSSKVAIFIGFILSMIGFVWIVSNLVSGNSEADDAARDCIKEAGYIECKEVCDRSGIDRNACISKLLDAYDEVNGGAPS